VENDTSEPPYRHVKVVKRRADRPQLWNVGLARRDTRVKMPRAGMPCKSRVPSTERDRETRNVRLSLAARVGVPKQGDLTAKDQERRATRKPKNGRDLNHSPHSKIWTALRLLHPLVSPTDFT
jgi:hypothetical protein